LSELLEAQLLFAHLILTAGTSHRREKLAACTLVPWRFGWALLNTQILLAVFSCERARYALLGKFHQIFDLKANGAVLSRLAVGMAMPTIT